MAVGQQAIVIWNEEAAQAAEDRAADEVKQNRESWNDWGTTVRSGTQRLPRKRLGESSMFGIIDPQTTMHSSVSMHPTWANLDNQWSGVKYSVKRIPF